MSANDTTCLIGACLGQEPSRLKIVKHILKLYGFLQNYYHRVPKIIDVQDVDLKKKTLVVTDKGEHVRIFDIPDSLCEAIAEWLECRETIMKGYHSQALLFYL